MTSERASRRNGSVKLVDVARQAGVSLATASRALSSPELVRGPTLEKVRDAVVELGYVPHGAARALASQRSKTIGAIFPQIDNPIFATATQSLAKELADDGYTLLLASHDYDNDNELAIATRLIERGVDGMVLVGLPHDPQLFELLQNADVPYELAWSIDSDGGQFSIGVDHRSASESAVQHLIDLGHRDFAMIAGIVEVNDRAEDRFLGAQDALQNANIELHDERVRQATFSVKSGRETFAELLRASPGFSALICGNDTLAIGALLEATSRRIDIPNELSIIGFDDIDLAAAVSPPLTTVNVPSAEIGKVAGRRLLRRLRGQEVDRVEVLGTSFIERGTTAPPPTN
jgi:LacI family transcriptional regulator